MKKAKFTLLSLLMLGSVTLSSCYVDLGFIQFGEKEETKKEVYDEVAQKKHIKEYYSSIDSSKSGDTLLSALKSLNLSKRKKTIGYNAMGTTSGSYYKYTDYDPATVKFTEKGIPYGTKILSFYSGKSTALFNREHVWPDSRGGNKVEDDIKSSPRINMVDDEDGEDKSQGFDQKMYFKVICSDNKKDGIYIIDQPEDDISQKSIRDDLIKNLRKMSKYRQIILVTHNPQFVVNLDVDNVICLSENATKNIMIHSGALEYKDSEQDILNDVAEILDGGVLTIRRRWKRYEKNIDDIIG